MRKAQMPTRLDALNLSLVFVRLALKSALEPDRMADLPVGFDIGAEEELLQDLAVGKGFPDFAR